MITQRSSVRRRALLPALAIALSFACATLTAQAAVPADCTQTTDGAKAVAACTTYLKDPTTAAAKDNEAVATAYASRAAGYQQQGLNKQALGDVTQALYRSPKNAKLWLQRGRVRLLLGQHIRCAADFSIALRYDAKLADAYVGRSECYRRLGALPKAIADADEALKIDPKSAPALASKGYAELRLGKTDAAATDAEAALKLDPNSARAYLTRGLAAEQSDKAKAEADVKKALSLDPGLKAEPGMAAILKRFSL